MSYPNTPQGRFRHDAWLWLKGFVTVGGFIVPREHAAAEALRQKERRRNRVVGGNRNGRLRFH